MPLAHIVLPPMTRHQKCDRMVLTHRFLNSDDDDDCGGGDGCARILPGLR